MRFLLMTLFVAAAAAALLPARDVADDRRPVRRATDPDQRDRLKQYAAAFRNLSSEAQDRIRQLDKELKEENEATRTRLTGVMERYALWLSRLSDADRKRIQAAPAGPERLQVVRAVMEQQWLDSLPPARKDQLAKATDTEQKSLMDRWRREEHQRQDDRVWTLRNAQEMMNPGQAERLKQFRDAVERFVKNDLEPKLTAREKTRLQTAAGRGVGTFAYLHLVWVLSQTHGLMPPGSPDIWAMFREPRK